MNTEDEMAQLMERTKFLSEWILHESAVQRRISLINNRIADLSNSSKSLGLFFKFKGTLKSIEPLFLMVWLKTISDNLLTDYIEGIVQLRLFLVYKKEEDGENCSRLITPSLIIFKDFMCSKIWQELIIERETTGQGSYTINGVTIPLSREEFKQQACRMGIFPMFPNISMAKIRTEHKKYYDRIYANEQKTSESSTSVFRPKFKDENIESIFVILSRFFEPKDQFMNFLTGELIEGKINFLGDQNKLAGIFIDLRETGDIETGTHQQTYNFIKQTFLMKGKPIQSKQIFIYLNEPNKANKQKFIDISI